MEERKPVVLLARQSDGRVVGQTPESRQVLGECSHRTCGQVMGCSARPGSPECQSAEPRRVTFRRKPYELRCTHVEDRIVSTLTPLAEGTDWERLTPREVDVLKHLAEGETTGEIATALGISEATVRAHVEHMRLRLGVGTRAALVSRGFRLGYLV